MKDNHSATLFAYNTWANEILVNHLKSISEEICHKNIKSVFPSIYDALMHIYIIDHGWYSLLTKAYSSDDYEAIKHVTEKITKELRNDNLYDFIKKQKTLADNFNVFITETDMEKIEIFSTLPMQYADIIQHVVNHGTYHRGNIAAMLCQLNSRVVATDFSLYLFNSFN